MKVKAVSKGSVFLNMENNRPPKKEIKKQVMEKSFSEHLKEQLEKKV